MDQAKTGRFIAARRRELGLTQRQLAERLSISEMTVSKWECGGGLPEVGLMLPLCETLGVSVNELLAGRRVEEEEYKEQAEANMMDLVRKNGDKIDADEKDQLTKEIDKLKEAMKSEDVDTVKAAVEATQKYSNEVFTKLYQKAGGAEGAQQAADDNVVDAEVVDDENKDK